MDQALQLIAIKPLKDCARKLLKVLNENEVYYLYKNYQILQFDNGREKIVPPKLNPPEIFNVGHICVNLSAIAGKNGSGKSSITELLYAVMYNISQRLDLIDEKDENSILYLEEPDVNVDIYYRLRGIHFRIRSYNGELTLSEFSSSGDGFVMEDPIEDISQLADLFYSVVINYSLYALNTEEIGHWIKAIFHKNDGYQTPVVLNPFRKAGVIDINTENYLVRSRMLANIMEIKDYALWFNDEGKTPKLIAFQLNTNKLNFKPHERARKNIIKNYSENWEVMDIFIRQSFFESKKIAVGSNEVEEFTKKYILAKLVSMCKKYKLYHRFDGFMKHSQKPLNLLDEIKRDKSHVAYKIKQAIYFLYLRTVPLKRENFAWTVRALRFRNAQLRRAYPEIPVIELVPPSFFDIDIEFQNEHDRFSYLSSGEKQKIYAISSLIYHLRNLNSVKDQSSQLLPPLLRLIKYQYVNIVFDEIELYYHPELQRRFIKDLLDNIYAADLKEILGINCLFITHSPFILSDIPNENILYLKIVDRKAVQWPQANETFGGNIHDLLANSFFLESNGYMGEHARQVINSLFYYLTPDNKKQQKTPPQLEINWNQETARAVIDMVGESLIRRSLNELYSDRFLREDDEIEREINRLRQLQAAKENKP